MEKLSQLYLSYADSKLTGNISLYRRRDTTVVEVVLNGNPDNNFNLIATLVLDVLSESACTHCVLNICDLSFYETDAVNEYSVGGVVTIISTAVDQGAVVAIISDDTDFRSIIDRAFKKHKRYKNIRTFSSHEVCGLTPDQVMMQF